MIGGMLNMLFLKILFLCTLYLSVLLKTNEEPKMNQGTPKELRNTKKAIC